MQLIVCSLCSRGGCHCVLPFTTQWVNGDHSKDWSPQLCDFSGQLMSLLCPEVPAVANSCWITNRFTHLEHPHPSRSTADGKSFPIHTYVDMCTQTNMVFQLQHACTKQGTTMGNCTGDSLRNFLGINALSKLGVNPVTCTMYRYMYHIWLVMSFNSCNATHTHRHNYYRHTKWYCIDTQYNTPKCTHTCTYSNTGRRYPYSRSSLTSSLLMTTTKWAGSYSIGYTDYLPAWLMCFKCHGMDGGGKEGSQGRGENKTTSG